jgi:hypothetical protein
MKQFLRNNLLYLLAIFYFTTVANAKTSIQKYFSPNQKLFAMIYHTQKAGEIMPESIVSIYNSQGKLLLQKSYVSSDHEHGYSVVQLKWTADSQFCVWSLTSSGGHSPWHFPTDCYLQKCNVIINIDTQLNCGLTQAKFKLQAPHVFLSQRLIPNPKGEPKYAKFKLDLNNLKCH